MSNKDLIKKIETRLLDTAQYCRSATENRSEDAPKGP